MTTRNNLLHILILPIFIIACACSNIDVLSDDYQPMNSLTISGRFYTDTEAATIAENFLNSLTKGSRTKSRQIKDVSVIRGIQTRSSESDNNDSLLYIINYVDNQGFVMLDARKPHHTIYEHQRT